MWVDQVNCIERAGIHPMRLGHAGYADAHGARNHSSTGIGRRLERAGGADKLKMDARNYG